MPDSLSDFLYGETYARLSGTEKEMKHICGHCIEEDNNPEHFWTTFSSIMMKWNPDFVYKIRERESPFFSDEAKAFFYEELKKDLNTSSALHMMLYNVQVLTEPVILSFLQELGNIDQQNCMIVLLYKKHGEKEEQKAPYFELPANSKLYYTQREEVDFYSSHGFEMSDEEAKTVRGYTNGWIPLCRLLLQLMEQNGRTIILSLERHLVHWLENEYLIQFNENELQALYNFSMLEEFPIELAHYIREYRGEIMVHFMRSSPLYQYDTEKGLFHVAPCYREKLREHHVFLSVDDKKAFFKKVAGWYEEQGDKVSATRYYIQAGAYKQILDLMLQLEFPNPRDLAQGFVDAVQEMPDSFREKYPMTEVMFCYNLCTLYRYQDAHDLLLAFCRKHDHGDKTKKEMRPVLGEAYYLLSYINICILFNDDNTMQNLKKTVELLPDGSALLQPQTSIMRDAPTLQLKSKKVGALEKSVALYHEIEPYLVHIFGKSTGCELMARCELYYYTHNFKEVETSAYKTIQFGVDSGQYDVVCNGYFLLMRYYIARGNYEKTMESYEKIQLMEAQMNYDTFYSVPGTAFSWLMLKLGKPDYIVEWLKDESIYKKKFAPWNYGWDRVLRCHYLLDSKQYDQALSQAEASSDWFGKRGLNILIVYLNLVKAICYCHFKETENMTKALNEVYDWTHENDMIMPIVECGSYVERLFEQYQSSGGSYIPRDWLNRLEKKANSFYVYCFHVRKEYEREHVEQGNPLAALSPNEKRILSMMKNGLTTKEIAQALNKSPSAIQSAMGRIYQKLDVSGKVDAIRIATMYNTDEQ